MEIQIVGKHDARVYRLCKNYATTKKQIIRYLRGYYRPSYFN